VQNRPRGKYSRETLSKYEPLSSKPDKNRRNEVEPNLNVRWRALAASDRRSSDDGRKGKRERGEKEESDLSWRQTYVYTHAGGKRGMYLITLSDAVHMHFGLPSSLVEVSEVLEEVVSLLLVRDRVLVEDLGHVCEYEVRVFGRANRGWCAPDLQGSTQG